MWYVFSLSLFCQGHYSNILLSLFASIYFTLYILPWFPLSLSFRLFPLIPLFVFYFRLWFPCFTNSLFIPLPSSHPFLSYPLSFSYFSYLIHPLICFLKLSLHIFQSLLSVYVSSSRFLSLHIFPSFFSPLSSLSSSYQLVTFVSYLRLVL